MSAHLSLGPRVCTALLRLCREAIHAVRVYVVSPYPTVRAGLSALVRAQEGWTVIGEMAPGAMLRASGSGPISDRNDPPDVGRTEQRYVKFHKNNEISPSTLQLL